MTSNRTAHRGKPALLRALNLTRWLLRQLNKDKTAFQRIFVQDVRKCEDMLRIIRFLKAMHAKVSIVCDAPVHVASWCYHRRRWLQPLSHSAILLGTCC